MTKDKLIEQLKEEVIREVEEKWINAMNSPFIENKKTTNSDFPKYPEEFNIIKKKKAVIWRTNLKFFIGKSLDIALERMKEKTLEEVEKEIKGLPIHRVYTDRWDKDPSKYPDKESPGDDWIIDKIDRKAIFELLQKLKQEAGDKE